MSSGSRSVSRQQLSEWGLPYELGSTSDGVTAVELHREQAGSLRWCSIHHLVFRAPDDGRAYLVTYLRGLTERQDQDPWDGEGEVAIHPAEPYEETVTRWRVAKPAGDAAGRILLWPNRR